MMGRRKLLFGFAVVAALAAGAVYGYVAATWHLPPAGLFRAAAAELHGSGGAARPDTAARSDFDRLRAVGYLGAEEDAPRASGVVVHDRRRADGSPLLYTSGHAAIAVLMDRDGAVLHTWERAFEDAFPDVTVREDQPPCDYFRKAWLFDNGDLLVIFEGQGLVKLDKDSRILWARRNHAHHDFHVSPSGEILVLTREVHVEPEWNPRRPILEGYIAVLDANGEELRRVSLLEAVQRSEYAGMLDYSPRWGDLMHTNTLEIVSEAPVGSPEVHRGSALVSFNTTNVIGLVDLEEERLTWAIAGLTDGNHDATFLENGNLLVFDNGGGGGDHSRVLEIDPLTQEIVWRYEGTDANGFYSWCCGANHRLPNGNTLITETAAGRAFEVTRENEIVWEFLNPYRDRENPELIAYVMEMLPVAADQLDWLSAE